MLFTGVWCTGVLAGCVPCVADVFVLRLCCVTFVVYAHAHICATHICSLTYTQPPEHTTHTCTRTHTQVLIYVSTTFMILILRFVWLFVRCCNLFICCQSLCLCLSVSFCVCWFCWSVLPLPVARFFVLVVVCCWLVWVSASRLCGSAAVSVPRGGSGPLYSVTPLHSQLPTHNRNTHTTHHVPTHTQHPFSFC